MHKKVYPNGMACSHVTGPHCAHSAKSPIPISITRQSLTLSAFFIFFVVSDIHHPGFLWLRINALHPELIKNARPRLQLLGVLNDLIDTRILA
jgi:hypothetical protein